MITLCVDLPTFARQCFCIVQYASGSVFFSVSLASYAGLSFSQPLGVAGVQSPVSRWHTTGSHGNGSLVSH